MSWHSWGGRGELNITALLEKKLWTVGLETREFQALGLKGRKKLLCVLLLFEILGDLQLLLMQLPCAPMQDSPVPFLRMLVGRWVCCVRSSCLLDNLFRPLCSHWCYLTLCCIPEWLLIDAFLLRMPDPVSEVCSFERKIQSWLSSRLHSHHFLHDTGFLPPSVCCESCWWLTGSCHLHLP